MTLKGINPWKGLVAEGTGVLLSLDVHADRVSLAVPLGSKHCFTHCALILPLWVLKHSNTQQHCMVDDSNINIGAQWMVGKY